MPHSGAKIRGDRGAKPRHVRCSTSASMNRLVPLVALVAIPLSAGCYKSSYRPESRTCEEREARDSKGPSLAYDAGELARVRDLVEPFDASRADLVGPDDRYAMFGRRPEIIVVPADDELHALVQDHEPSAEPRAVVLRLTPHGDDYVVTAVVEAPILDRIMGFARDEEGAYFVASGIDEERHDPVTAWYPAPSTYRGDVVRVTKLSPEGTVLFDVDVDPARGRARPDALPLVGPMTRSTSALAYGGGRLALVHGILGPAGSSGERAQLVTTTYLGAADGAILGVGGSDSAASYDVRVLGDGSGFLELHLRGGAARGIELLGEAGARRLAPVKGRAEDENTYARLGGLAALEDHDAWSHVALVALEHGDSTAPTAPGDPYVAGARDLALVGVPRAAAAPASAPVWLTRYDLAHGGSVHAERPKLVAIGEGRLMVLWERWERHEGAGAEPTGTWGMIVGADGDVLVAPAELTRAHLPRGDHAFPLRGGAAFVTGDSERRELRLHLVGATLEHREIVIE